MPLPVLGMRRRRFSVSAAPATFAPTDLPLAAQQHPAWGTFPATMRTAAAGDILTEPTTSARYLKITGTGTHGGGNGSHEYASGTAIFSLPWTSGANELVTLAYRQGGADFLCDINTSTGAISNRRAITAAQLGWMAFTFSRNPATPRIGFYLKTVASNNNWLSRYDTSTNAEAATGNFPKDLSSLAVDQFNGWLVGDDNDRWFAFQDNPPTDYMVAYDSQTNTAISLTLTEIQALIPSVDFMDEPHMTRDGLYIVVDAAAGATQKSVRWTLATDSLTDITSVFDPNHQEDIGALAFHKGGNGLQTYDPGTNTATNRYNTNETMDGGNHSSGQWKQTGADLDKWVTMSGSYSGWLAGGGSDAPGWTLDSGTAGVDGIYRTTPTYFSGSGQSSARMAANGLVSQYETANSNRIRANLTKVGSLGALTAAGQWFHDQTPNTLYVRPLDELLLASTDSGKVRVSCPPDVHDGICFIRLGGASATGGKNVRLYGHHYSLLSATVQTYEFSPRAQQSQCGRFIVFDSNMGDKATNARVDVWVAMPPLT